MNLLCITLLPAVPALSGVTSLTVCSRGDWAELYRYYSQGSIFVIASIEEGLALVQAQAMACGLPVIATTNTGAEDLFSDGVEGFVVPIRDADAIAERIARLLSRPDDREMMAQAALKRVAAIGGWDAYGQRALSAYASGLTSRAPNGQRSNSARLPA